MSKIRRAYDRILQMGNGMKGKRKEEERKTRGGVNLETAEGDSEGRERRERRSFLGMGMGKRGPAWDHLVSTL